MTDIQYWDDTLTDEIEAITNLVDQIPNISDRVEKSEAIERCKSRIRSAGGTKRSFKMEIRLVQDVGQRRNYDARLQQLDQQLGIANADVKALESEMTRGELFVNSTNNANADDHQNEQDGVKAGDTMLKDASAIQDKTQQSLGNTKALIAESKEVGVSTLAELQRQREVLHSIEKEADRLDDNLQRAEQLLKAFGKRIAGDHFIQCFALVNVLLFIGVILYAVIEKGGFTGGGDESKVDETIPINPTGVGGGRRILLNIVQQQIQKHLRGGGE